MIGRRTTSTGCNIEVRRIPLNTDSKSSDSNSHTHRGLQLCCARADYLSEPCSIVVQLPAQTQLDLVAPELLSAAAKIETARRSPHTYGSSQWK